MRGVSRWRLILLNRFVLVPGAIVLAIVLWNLYVATHNHGLITGRVIDPAGRPVADATVALWIFNFTTYEEKERVKTDADGTFRFTSNPSHRIQLSAEKPPIPARTSGREVAFASGRILSTRAFPASISTPASL